MREQKTKSKSISVLGCGWLGLPLAKTLIANGFLVKGSTTSVEKISVLEESGIQPFFVNLSGAGESISENETNGNLTEFLINSEILIIDIPPKLRSSSADNFVRRIENLIPYIEKSSVKKVLFVSSASVYSDDNSVVTEETIAQPDTESGKQLLDTERLLQKNTNFKTTILRFGGLIGEDRHPIKHISGRENLENPDGAINLIHQQDCIRIILKIIETQCWNETFNAVAPFHPTREEYYTKKAIELNLPLPKFSYRKPSIGKTISSAKIENYFQYKFSLNTL